MQRPISIWHGAAGGSLAGLVVAIWFLAVDVSAGTPFLTPALLGSVVFHQEFAYPGARLVALYSLLHFAAFAALGVMWIGFLRAIRAEPGLLLGMVYGLLVLNAFHYSALLMGGTTAALVLPPVHVVLANFAGGIAYMLYLHRATRSESPIGLAVLREHPLLTRGISVGIVGAVAVAVWFLLIDTLTGQPFRTPAALGSALLFGAEGPADIRFNLGVIAAYTVVHVSAFSLLAIAFVAVADRVREVPSRWLLFVLTLVMLESLFLGTIGAVGTWVLHTLGMWTVLVANFIGIGAMGAVLWVQYPELRQLVHQPLDTAV